MPAFVIVTQAGADLEAQRRRVQAVADNGAGLGITVVVLGAWPSGVTCRIDVNGVVVHATGPGSHDLVGTRVFTAPIQDTRQILDLLNAIPAQRTRTQPTPTGDHQTERPTKVDARRPTDDRLSTAFAPTPPGLIEARLNPTGEAGSIPTVALSPGTDDPTPQTPVGLLSSTAPRHADQPIPVIDRDPSDPKAPPNTPPATPLAAESRPTPGGPVWSLSVLGPMSLTWRQDDVEQEISAALAPKHWALLVFLALHPAGTTREIVREALWPDTRGNRPYNAYYTTLTQVRKALHAATDDGRRIIVQRGERIGLDPELTEVDYWQLLDAEHAARVASTTDSRTTAWSTIVAVYGGDLADGIDALWLDGPREAARRTTVDALARLAALSRGHNPERHLQLLERARLLDRYNEDIYRDIMRVQAELGLIDAIPRTLALLATTLGDNNEHPTAETVALAHALQSRRRQADAAAEPPGPPSAQSTSTTRPPPASERN